MLSSRRQRVLTALVDEYVQSATPVGSNRIARQYLTEVSPATVRNELMGLEIEGYALSPHTSAGRVPTNSGYQVFVNALLLRERLNLSLRETPHAGIWGDHLDTDLHTLDLDHHVDWILGHLSEMTGLLSVLCTFKPEVYVRHRGMPQLLAQPEFHDSSALLPLIQLIEDRATLANVFMGTLWGSGFHVKIGIEDTDEQLSTYSMVAEFFGSAQLPQALAVFGPTRMNYRKAIPAVLTAARLLERKVGSLWR